MGKPRVVVVDDHELVRKGITSALSAECDVCGEAAEGQEAVQKVLELHPDLVLLDLNLRGEMTGTEAARQIRSMAPQIKILVLSVHDTNTVAMLAKSIGADGFLSKNCSSEELRRTIAELVAASG